MHTLGRSAMGAEKSRSDGLLEQIRRTPLWRVLRMPLRFWFAFSYYRSKLMNLLVWVVRSREDTNLTYDLTEDNLDYLAHTVSVVTGLSFGTARGYIDEVRHDKALREHVARTVAASRFRFRADNVCYFSRRVGWYAFVRALKPRVVVESGVDKGHGAVVIGAALLRNAEEGHPGRYFGTDIESDAGWLFTPPYSSTGEILYGDSIASLRALSTPIDLFINDSDHSAEYEYREYQTVREKLSPGAVILGDNAHVTSKLAQFSRENERAFLFFREVPHKHWYPGAGIGISYLPQGRPG